MYHCEYFYNNWLDIFPVFEADNETKSDCFDLPINLPKDFFKNIQLDVESLESYRKEAARRANKILGHNPALCLSGGVDSQAMVLCWLEANLDFQIYTLVFEDNLNIQDLECARAFCKSHNLILNEIPINIKYFLSNENYDCGIKYKSPSPHFNTHFKLFDILKSKGSTGICCGGDVPGVSDGIWGRNLNRNAHNFVTYSQLNQFPVIGNFLSFSPELTWSIALQTKPIEWPKYKSDNFPEHTEQQNERKIRYQNKIEGYTKAGLQVVPQKQKYTGFELVNAEYARMTGNGWEFEQKFRVVLEAALQQRGEKTCRFRFDDETFNDLQTIFNKLQP